MFRLFQQLIKRHSKLSEKTKNLQTDGADGGGGAEEEVCPRYLRKIVKYYALLKIPMEGRSGSGRAARLPEESIDDIIMMNVLRTLSSVKFGLLLNAALEGDENNFLVFRNGACLRISFGNSECVCL